MFRVEAPAEESATRDNAAGEMISGGDDLPLLHWVPEIWDLRLPIRIVAPAVRLVDRQGEQLRRVVQINVY